MTITAKKYQLELFEEVLILIAGMMIAGNLI